MINWDADMKENIFDLGGRIGNDGLAHFDRYSRERMEDSGRLGRSAHDYNVHTLTIRDRSGLCLIIEGKHFVLDD